MPVKPNTKVTLLRIAAVLYALTRGLALAAAFEDRSRARIAQAVLWFSLCIVFLSVAARFKRKASQSKPEDSDSV